MELAGTEKVLPDVSVGSRLLARPVDAFLTWMRPRDPRHAARTVSALCAVGLVVTLVTVPMGANAGTELNGWAIALAAFSLLLALMISAAAWFFDEASRLAWGLCPFAAIVVVVLVDLATHDGSVTAQIFFFFPTVYGGALLPRPGAILVTSASLAGEVVVVFSQLSVREATVSTCYVAAALATTAAILVQSMERQHELALELAHLATIDPLTGLVTRRAFDEAVVAVLAHPGGDEGTSLVVIDVDRFKSVNDQYGHPAGDMVLVHLSDLLVQASRRGDVVCRLGGDEIAMLLPRCTLEIALRRAEEIVELVRQEGFEVSADDLIQVSISAGLAHVPTHGSDLRTLYAAADAALYDAKRGGRDRVMQFEGEVDRGPLTTTPTL
jgi:diguanylate cyclase (GGDEF)-like protein